METKYTPGPWEYNTDSRWPNCVIAPRAIPGALGLARVCEAHYLSDADAKLIAAAPDYDYATKRFVAGWKHFLACIDFGASNLDADAIRFMNEVPGLLQTAITKATT